MYKICLTGAGYTDQHYAKLREKQFEITHVAEDLTQTELQKILPGFDAYVLGGNERFTDNELRLADKLRVISFVGTGYSSFIDEKSAIKYNVAIRNTPAVMAPAVAEHAIGFLIGLQRQLFEQNSEVKQSCVKPHLTHELSSLCIGIVGLGEIGSRIARILRTAFGSTVVYHCRQPKKLLEAELSIHFASMDTLFSTADAIMLALPTNDETEYFINDSLLGKTKSGAMIINVAGARLIEPGALKAHLDNGHLSAVALDGYYIEPLPAVNEDPYGLLSLPDSKFIVTPHTAAKTQQSWERMVDMAIDNVITYFM